MPRIASAVLLLLCASGTLADGAPAPLVIADFDTFEVGADRGVTVLATRSRTAEERLVNAVREFLRARGYGDAPSVAPEDLRDPAALESLALAQAVAESQGAVRRAGGRIIRAADFAWRVGPGLEPMAAQAGAAAVLYVGGYRARPTANRVLSQSLLSAAALTISPPVFLVPGLSTSATAVAALVEPKTGAILWSSAVYGSSAEPDRDNDARELVERLLESFPAAGAPTGSAG